MPAQSWTSEGLARVLADRYGLVTQDIDALVATGGAAEWDVTCSGPNGGAFRVVQYPDPEHAEAGSRGLTVAAFAGSAGVCVPSVRRDREGNLVSCGPEGYVAAFSRPKGRPVIAPLRAEQARLLGLELARVHRGLAFYPPATPQPMGGEAAWRTWPLNTSGAEPAMSAGGHRATSQRRTLLAQIPTLRRQLPTLTFQTGHGAFLRRNLYLTSDRVEVTGFRGRTTFLAWELARIAFDIRTVLDSVQWRKTALSCLAAYHIAYPHLPINEVRASPLIAVLELLCAPAQPSSPPWPLRVAATQRLLRWVDDYDDFNAMLTQHLDQVRRARGPV